MDAAGDAASLGAGDEVVCAVGDVEDACVVDASANASGDGDAVAPGLAPTPAPGAAEPAGHAGSRLDDVGTMGQRYHLILYCQLTILFELICRSRQGRTVVVEIVVVLHFEESAIASLENEMYLLSLERSG